MGLAKHINQAGGAKGWPRAWGSPVHATGVVAWSPRRSVPRLLPLAPGFAPTYGPEDCLPASHAFGPWTFEPPLCSQA